MTDFETLPLRTASPPASVTVGFAVLDEAYLEALGSTGGTAVACDVIDGDVLVVSPSGRYSIPIVRDPHRFEGGLCLQLGTGAQAATVWNSGDEVAVRIDHMLRPARPPVFDRLRGVFDPSGLASKAVLMVGLGSGGSAILRELVRSGVGRFALVDHDRLEVANVCRHELGLQDVGRLKVKALAEYVQQRNPSASVHASVMRVSGKTRREFEALIDEFRPDLVVCGTDNRPSRLLVNRLAVTHGINALYGGVRRQAYAGDVLHVVPGLSPCYQCFVRSLPPSAVMDSEVSSEEDARRFAYDDLAVDAQPGISVDIAPVSLLMARLALVGLLDGDVPASFGRLRIDLTAPYYVWLNRRETGFEHWPALSDDTEVGPRILSWIPQWIERDPACEVCAPSARG